MNALAKGSRVRCVDDRSFAHWGSPPLVRGNDYIVKSTDGRFVDLFEVDGVFLVERFKPIVRVRAVGVHQ